MLWFSPYVSQYEISSDTFTKSVPKLMKKGTIYADKFSHLAYLERSYIISLEFYCGLENSNRPNTH